MKFFCVIVVATIGFPNLEAAHKLTASFAATAATKAQPTPPQCPVFYYSKALPGGKAQFFYHYHLH